MAESTLRKDAREGTPECRGVREALAQGDYRAARALAAGVLQSEAASPAAKAEAARLARATRVDRWTVVAGLVVLAVLTVLFLTFVAGRP